jgi:hypothetical protein
MPRHRHKKPLPGSDPDIEKLAADMADKVPGKKIVSRSVRGEDDTRNHVLNIRTTSVAWGIPMDEVMYSKFMSNFFRLGMMPWDNALTTESTYLPDARNTIHHNYLKVAASPYLFMLDSDVLAPPDVITRLLAHDKAMIGGWYRDKEHKKPVVYDYINTSEDGVNHYRQREEPSHGLEKVDGAGAGCWLMRRDVAEALGLKPYDMNSGGEDLLLCKKINDLGFDLWIDWDIACAHAGVWYV